ncbi:hypothetical protein Nepgr_011453 [Nepenthes gracilis]|uniref:Uncharacterized protein n=1 Tax=Nepenthes gracilis TaxID=150966 RepID=A0AAD3XLZ7_NEPGR|nr:hypothetical protein Nepgr_011453 [Nepenthes gracilis]
MPKPTKERVSKVWNWAGIRIRSKYLRPINVMAQPGIAFFVEFKSLRGERARGQRGVIDEGILRRYGFVFIAAGIEWINPSPIPNRGIHERAQRRSLSRLTLKSSSRFVDCLLFCW